VTCAIGKGDFAHLSVSRWGNLGGIVAGRRHCRAEKKRVNARLIVLNPSIYAI
jgi:hypothetical protein